MAADRRLDLSSPLCMGILNVTPDSFSDGGGLGRAAAGAFRADRDRALRRAESMVAAGAAIVDVGGESTRPGAAPVGEQEELDRTIPVVQAIRGRLDACVSVDTGSPAVMREAIAAGAGMINDVRALRAPGAAAAVRDHPVAVCLAHMRGEPRTMQEDCRYGDVVEEVRRFLAERVAACEAAGIGRDRLVVDPGFGFGKTAAQNYRLLARLDALRALGLPVLAGLSRKSMIGEAVGRPPRERAAGSTAAATLALRGGAAIIRSHDVADTVDAIGVYCAFRGARSPARPTRESRR